MREIEEIKILRFPAKIQFPFYRASSFGEKRIKSVGEIPHSPASRFDRVGFALVFPALPGAIPPKRKDDKSKAERDRFDAGICSYELPNVFFGEEMASREKK